jgi:tetratricopeptide (TPR) repeat protein
MAGEDYNAAASVLIEIDDNCLSVWGHYRLLVDGYERLQGKLADSFLEWLSIRGLGVAYGRTGQFEKSLTCFTNSLSLARRQEYKVNEASSLVSLSWLYGDLGEHAKAIEFGQQALSMYEELHDKSGEGAAHANLAIALSALGQFVEAIEQYEKAIALDKEVKSPQDLCLDTNNLASVYAHLGYTDEAKRLAGDAQRMAHELGYKLIKGAATIQVGVSLGA